MMLLENWVKVEYILKKNKKPEFLSYNSSISLKNYLFKAGSKMCFKGSLSNS